MAKQRHVDKLMAVFSLDSCRTLGLPETLPSQVMFLYDRKTNLTEFSLLNDQMTNHMHKEITRWLKENVGLDDVLHVLASRELSVEELS